MKNSYFHTSFRLNENAFTSVEDLLSFSKLDEKTHCFLKDWFSSDDFINVQTSGSTGVPKVICLKKQWMINSAKATGLFFDLKQDTSAFLCLSTDYIAGKMMLVRALVLGWQLDFVQPVANPLEKVKKTYDFSAFAPMQLYHSLEKLDQIKKLIVGGGFVSKELIDKLQNVKTQVFETYGMTETCTHIATRKLNHFSSGLEERIEKSYFQIFPEVKISQDDRNCLIINAPRISDRKIITNDVVKIISKNQFKWLGRFDNVINSSGVKLHPEKIEQKLSSLIKERFFVYGIPDKILNEKLILIVEKYKIYKNEDKILRNKISKLNSIDKYEVPKEIHFVSRFVQTKTKKIRRRETVELVRA